MNISTQMRNTMYTYAHVLHYILSTCAALYMHVHAWFDATCALCLLCVCVCAHACRMLVPFKLCVICIVLNCLQHSLQHNSAAPYCSEPNRACCILSSPDKQLVWKRFATHVAVKPKQKPIPSNSESIFNKPNTFQRKLGVMIYECHSATEHAVALTHNCLHHIQFITQILSLSQGLSFMITSLLLSYNYSVAFGTTIKLSIKFTTVTTLLTVIVIKTPILQLVAFLLLSY